MKTRLSGWGLHPQVDVDYFEPTDWSQWVTQRSTPWISRGLGRSYGDSSLSQTVANTRFLQNFLSFEESTGMLHCQAGVSFQEILEIFMPRGWFLPVTPGTQFVTVGGAIASDVHGKNHHTEGSLGNHVQLFHLLQPQGEVLECSRQKNSDLFWATLGGMGLTGTILDAKVRLKKIQGPWIDQISYKAKNLAELFELFETHQQDTYSVAWVDVLSRGSSLGRSLLMAGEHSSATKPQKTKSRLSIPCTAPSWILNKGSVWAFNQLYYHKQWSSQKTSCVNYETFFYPLDSIHNWNRLYGRKGFTQYQFVIPKTDGLQGMSKILDLIAQEGNASFLAVLKLFGAGNSSPLSFPMEGYTLALDFTMNRKTLDLLDRLDPLVMDLGGRIYLTKDSRMSAETFRRSYPRYPEFLETLEKHSLTNSLQSLQSQRLRIGLP